MRSGYEMDLTKTLGWRLTSHARTNCIRRGVTTAEALTTAAAPEITYDQFDHGPGRQIRQRGDLAVVTVPEEQLILTVLSRQQNPWTDELFRGRRQGLGEALL